MGGGKTCANSHRFESRRRLRLLHGGGPLVRDWGFQSCVVAKSKSKRLGRLGASLQNIKKVAHRSTTISQNKLNTSIIWPSLILKVFTPRTTLRGLFPRKSCSRAKVVPAQKLFPRKSCSRAKVVPAQKLFPRKSSHPNPRVLLRTDSTTGLRRYNLISTPDEIISGAPGLAPKGRREAIYD
jgi:hypothetical protein